ncbi:unnamed protein product [Malus baccata var. baccata]
MRFLEQLNPSSSTSNCGSAPPALLLHTSLSLKEIVKYCAQVLPNEAVNGLLAQGSDLNGGVAAVIGEIDHGDASTRKMDAWGTWRVHSKRPSCSEAGNHFFPSLYAMATSKSINHQSHP